VGLIACCALWLPGGLGISPCVQHAVSSNGSTCASGSVQWLVRNNIDLPGSDITSVNGLTVDGCQALCFATPGCMSAVLSSDGVGTCWLKNAVPTAVASNVRISMTFTCCDAGNGPCVPHSVSSAGGNCSSGRVQWLVRNNIDIPGSDITSVYGQTIDSCQNLCFATPGCMSAALSSDGAGTCWLKNTVPAAVASNVRTSMTFTCCDAAVCLPHQTSSQCSSLCSSGLVQWNVTNNVDMPNFDITSVQGQTVATCQDLCFATTGCMAAVLSSDGAGTCWLKNRVPSAVASNVRISMTFMCC